MSSKYSQIRSGTTELAALEHPKSMLPLFLVSQLCLYMGNSQVSVYRTIGPLVIYKSNEFGLEVIERFTSDMLAFKIIQFLMLTRPYNLDPLTLI